MRSQEEANLLLEKSKNILIIDSQENSIDKISASIALYFLLKNKDKKVTLFHNQDLPQKIAFLKKPKNVTSDLSGSRDFLLIFDTKRNAIRNVDSLEEKNKLTIRITPEKSSIDPRDFSFVPADFSYDLVITLGVNSLFSLGKVYEKNTDLFFEVPKLNIDNSPSNENFGQVNLIDLTASSICEICTELFSLKNKNIPKEISQPLLTGIIRETESFQNNKTTPQTMLFSANLMKQRADQSEIIRHLYKTKSLKFLKLWGKSMANLKINDSLKFAYSLIPKNENALTIPNRDEIAQIIEEMQKNFSDCKIFGIFIPDDENGTKSFLKFSEEKNTKLFTGHFQLPEKELLNFNLKNKRPEEAKKIFIEAAKKLHKI